MLLTPGDLLLALRIASQHEKKLEDQKLLALAIADWALCQSDAVPRARLENAKAKFKE